MLKSVNKMQISIVVLMTVLQMISAASGCSLAPASNCTNEVVFGISSRNCFVFENSCVLDLQNCKRITTGLKALQKVSRETCEQFCSDMCSRHYDPVCAEYNGVEKTFPNRCSFLAHNCRNALPFVAKYRGRCGTDDQQ